MPTPEWGASPSWQTALSGSGIDWFSAVAAAPDGGIYAVGTTESNDQDFAGSSATSDHPDAVVAKFTATGQRVWVKTFGGTTNDGFDGVAIAADGGIVVCGYTDSTDGNLITESNAGTNDALVAKISADGDLIWATTVGGDWAGSLSSVTLAADGSIYAAGSGMSDANGGAGVATKVTADGKVVWTKTYGTWGVEFNSVIADPAGGVMAAGSTSSTQGSLPKSSDSGFEAGDGLMVKLAGDGTMSWHKTFPGTSDTTIYAAALTPDGNFIATAGDLIVRTDTKGKVLSQNPIAPVSATAYGVTGLAALPNGLIVMAIVSYGVGVPDASNTSASVVALRNDTELQFMTSVNNGVHASLNSVAATADGTTVVAVGTLTGSGTYDSDAFIVAFQIG